MTVETLRTIRLLLTQHAVEDREQVGEEPTGGIRIGGVAGIHRSLACQLEFVKHRLPPQGESRASRGLPGAVKLPPGVVDLLLPAFNRFRSEDHTIERV